MPARKSKSNKKFTLHPGDVVVFKDVNNTVHAGQLLVRPHGRRPWAAVKETDTGNVFILPSRKHILEKVISAEDAPEVSAEDVREAIGV